MSLISGARLGPYEIVSPLGAGGMGEVYRAKDGRLNRTVAIKILSDESAADADRRERFEREAKAISALDHPNICALYDVGEHEGTYFLVMPCLEGQTLADRLAKGALPPDQAIKCAIEIAIALDAAHRHGIIHRDLKPGNIMLTRTGVKLLDFGLAKLKKAPGPLGDTTMVKGTGIGTLLGTMPYMAPEQIEGRDVDARSDIFSLGAVIYEMVTGQRAFKGESPASVIGAILKDEPAPMRSLQPLTPAALDHVVSTCLEKDADDRWQSSADIARELKWIQQVPAAAGSVARSRAQLPWMVAVATATLALVAAITLPSWRAADASGETIRFPLLPPEGGAFVASRSSIGILEASVSPDGSQVAFVATGANRRAILWLRTLKDPVPRELRDTGDAANPFWSPDSKMVGFFANGRLKTVDVASGEVRDLCNAARAPRGGTWNRDGVIVFGGDSGSGLSRVSTSSGVAEVATAQGQNTNSHRWPWFLPDGRRFLYYARGEESARGIYVGSLDGGEPRRILETVYNAQYANGYILTMKDGTLIGYPFDERSATITGDAVTIVDHLSGSSTQSAAFSVSTTGVLIYAGAVHEVSQMAWRTRDGHESSAGIQPGNILNFRLSPDDTQVVLSRVDPITNTSDIWVVELQRSAPTRFTLNPMNDISPVWSPDGQRVAFRSDRTGGNILFGKAFGAGSDEQALSREDVANPSDWSPDGRYVIFHQAVAINGLDVGMADLNNGGTRTFLANTLFDEYDGRVSPDGRWIAYVSEESGAPEVYAQSFPQAGGKWLMSAGGGTEPRWRHDGRELYYLAPSRQVMAVAVTESGSALRAGLPKILFQTPSTTYANPYQMSIEPTRDGTRFLVRSVASTAAASSSITIVLNWPSDLHRR